MKHTQLFFTLIIGQLLFSTSVNATDITDSTALSKQYYHVAKNQFKDMLSGKEELSYEKAITVVESAYYENEVNLVDFKLIIDFHIENIKRIIEANYDESALKVERILHKSEEQQKEEYRNALTNWAIFSYLTDTTLYFIDNQLLFHLPYQYNYEDPLGTINWQNTQVFNLLDNKTGNCYALVSLFKIFSERLNSEAFICTAPGHIYIRHADHKGIYHNVELANKAFPGTGSMETLTYTTDKATKNGISLRELDLKQSVALNLVYLAKGYEYKFGLKDDDFIMECAELALQYDELNLNAMLLKAEVLEERLIKKDKTIKTLQSDITFQEYEKLITHLFDLGYREMPSEMKDLVISRLRKEDNPYPMTNHTPKSFQHLGVKEERYATLSNGLFDEQMLTKPIEHYHRTMFDTKQKKIIELVELDTTYNKYPIDLVVFAWQIDPLYAKYPSISPYAAFANNPIIYVDPDGADIVFFNDKAQEVRRVVTDKVNKTFVLRQGYEYSGKAVHHITSKYGWSEAAMPNIILAKGNASTTSAKYQEHDYQIAASVFVFNEQKNNGTLSPIYTENGKSVIPGEEIKNNVPDLDPTLIKAVGMQETALGTNINDNDILETSNAGDEAGYKTSYGGDASTVAKSIDLGIKYLLTKGYRGGVGYNQATGEKSYTWTGGDNWLDAAGNYNGGGTAGYQEAVTKMWKSSVSGKSGNYSSTTSEEK